MAQVKIHVRFNKRTMGALYHSLYFDVDEELMIDGDNVNQEYSKKIAMKTGTHTQVPMTIPRT